MKVVDARKDQDSVKKVLDQHGCVIHGGPAWICTAGNRQAIIPRTEMDQRPWYRRIFNCAPKIAGTIIIDRCDNKPIVREIHMYSSKYLSLCKSIAASLEGLSEQEIIVRAFQERIVYADSVAE